MGIAWVRTQPYAIDIAIDEYNIMTASRDSISPNFSYDHRHKLDYDRHTGSGFLNSSSSAQVASEG